MAELRSAPFRAAVEAEDVAAAGELLAEGVVFRSPVVFKPYEGKALVAEILKAASRVFEDFRYLAQMESEDGAALVFEARVGQRQVQGLDFLRFDEEGRISELTVMMRPLSGVNAMAEAMRAQFEAAGIA